MITPFVMLAVWQGNCYSRITEASALNYRNCYGISRRKIIHYLASSVCPTPEHAGQLSYGNWNTVTLLMLFCNYFNSDTNFGSAFAVLTKYPYLCDDIVAATFSSGTFERTMNADIPIEYARLSSGSTIIIFILLYTFIYYCKIFRSVLIIFRIVVEKISHLIRMKTSRNVL
jgi:hypothetical protein